RSASSSSAPPMRPPRSGTGDARASGSALLLLVPACEFVDGAVVPQRAVLHPQREQVLVCLADERSGADAEDRHDLVAVEVRPDRRELLLLAQFVDAPLERVVRGGQGSRLL